MLTKGQKCIPFSPIIKVLLFFYWGLLCATSLSAQKVPEATTNYILVINSYTEADPWSLRIISAITGYIQTQPQLALRTEHMNMMVMSNDTVLDEFKQVVLDKYKKTPPRMLLLLGNSTLILKDDFRKRWGDIPIILCAENNYTGPIEAYLKKSPIAPCDQIPISDLAKPYNIVLLHSDLYIKENIKLISQVVPKMKRFIFISDKRQVGQTNNETVQQEMATNYPHLNYTIFSPDKININQLLDTLRVVDPETTGVLYSSWFYNYTYAKNTSLSSNSHIIIATSPAPLFSIGMLTLKDYKEGMIGGYAYDQDIYNQKIVQVIEEILNGKAAREIPFYLPSNGVPTINYTVLQRKGLSANLCPAETVFFNKPLTFWEKYLNFIIGTIISIILIILFFQYRIYHLNQFKKAQRKEIEAMTSYANLINNMPLLYMQKQAVINDKGEVVELLFRNVNTYFEKKFLTKEEIIGKKTGEIFPESMSEFLPFVEISLKESRAITFPYYSKYSNAFYDVVLKGSKDDNIVDIFCLDSTELHKAQQKLRATNNKLTMALEVASIVPWKWDLISKTILCDVNKPIELSTPELNIDEEQLAVPDSQYFAKILTEDRKRVMKAYEDLIEGRSSKVIQEYRVVNIQNHAPKIEWVEAQAAVETRDSNGKPLTLVGSSLIITKRKTMEMELTTAKNRAEESNRLKSAFLANMSHEIRTPLNAIVGFSGILATTDKEDEKQEYLNIIDNNNTLLLQLISDILDLSKIEAGTLEFQYSNFDLNKTMRELTNSLRLKLSSDLVQLNFHPTMEVCMIHTEKNRLSQLLINLITNAIKFTTAGSIDFGYELQDQELYFYVKDTGCGIAKEKQSSVFERFVKLNSFKQGTGLGLSICQTLIEYMGGRIGVDSEVDMGSTFWFTLPFNPAKEIDKISKEAETKPISIEKAKLTILIAEDNDSNYKLFASILKDEYQLIHAWNGQEAVDMYHMYSPHIILMDINMPIMDGYEATNQIRKHSTKVPIIAVTAFAYASDEQRVMESGFNGYIPKPINARQLKTQLIDIMQGRIILL